MNIEKIIYKWVKENFGESEANDPSWNIKALAKYIERKQKEEKKTTKEFAKLIIDTIDGEAKYGDAYTLDIIYNLCEKELKKRKG